MMLTPADARELQIRCAAEVGSREVLHYSTFLVSEEMRDLAFAAAQSFPQDQFLRSEVPTPNGFMVIDQPRPLAFVWASDPLVVIAYDVASSRGRSFSVDFDEQAINPGADTVIEDAIALLVILRTIWALMQMPYVSTDVRRARRTSIDKRNKSKLRSNTISVIDLRRSARSTTPTPTGRHLTARHYRRGTWNWQPYGPGNSLRRKQYRRPTIVGPDGTPIIVRDKVNYFRR